MIIQGLPVYPKGGSDRIFGICLIFSEFANEWLNSGFSFLLPTLIRELGSESVPPFWIAGIFNLIVASSLLPLTRWCPSVGPYKMFMIGLLCTSVACILAGSNTSSKLLCTARAFQGLGVAAMIPARSVLSSKIYEAGRERNKFYGTLAAAASVGAMIGMLVAATCAQHLSWTWYFRILGILTAVAFCVAWKAVPDTCRKTDHQYRSMDWCGAVSVALGLILVEYALAVSPYVAGGWKSSGCLAPLAIGVCSLVLAVYFEGWYIQDPLLPRAFFRPSGLKAFSLACSLLDGSFNVFLYYSVLYVQNVLLVNPLLSVAWYTPICVTGVFITLILGRFSHAISPKYLLLGAAAGSALAPLCIILMKQQHGLYWQYFLPAMICSSVGIDTSYALFGMVLSHSQHEDEQGLAGTMSILIPQLAMSFWLFPAQGVALAFNHHEVSSSYKAALWLSLSLGVLAAAVSLSIIRVTSPADLPSLSVQLSRTRASLRYSTQLDHEKHPMDYPPLIQWKRSSTGSPIAFPEKAVTSPTDLCFEDEMLSSIFHIECKNLFD